MARDTKYSHYNVDPLNGNNYEAWKFRVETILIEHSVEDMIRTEYRAEGYTDENRREEAKKRDNKCKSIIVQCIEDTQIDIVRNKETAYAMWKSLKDIYEKKGLSGQLFLRRKLMSMKMEENEKIEDFLLKFNRVLCQLKTSGAEIKEEDTVCMLLLALPKSYETVVTVLENLPTENLNMDFIKAKLRTEAEKKQEICGSRDEIVKPTAFISKKSQTCHNCGEDGHFKRDCKKSIRNQPNYNGSRGNTYREEINRGGKNQRGRNFRTRPRYQRRGNFYPHPWYNQNQDIRKGNYVEADNAGDDSVCFMSDRDKSIQNKGNDEIVFFIDSGCTDHLINEKSYFNDLMMLKNPIKIAIAKDRSYIEAIGIGNVNVLSYVNGKTVKCTIKNVLYVPNLRRNLLSVKKLEMCDIKVIFGNGEVQLLSGKNLIGIGTRNNLYEISFKVSRNECLSIEVEDEMTKLWHKRYGHISYANLKKLRDYKMVDGIKELNLNKVEFCESCINGKMTRLPFKTRKRSSSFLEIVHSDVCGPITPTSHDDNKFFMTFIDDYSNFVYVYIIKNKSEVFNCFREYAQMVQTKFRKRISTLRCDNGREYYSNEFKNYCKENGTVIDYTVPYTPQQNGKAERFNRSLVEKARSMMSDSNVPKHFWNEAIRTAAYLLNRSPNVNLDSITPAELWYDRRPDVTNLKVFGSIAYSHVPEQFRNKFDEKSEKCVVMGYAQNGYRLWNIEKRKIQVSRNVVFNESTFYYKMNKKIAVSVEENDEIKDREDIMEKETSCENQRKLDKDNLQETKEQVDVRNNKRNKKVPRRFDDYEMYMAFDALSYVEQVPKDYSDLNDREDRDLWERAMNREIESINKNNTWKSVIKPKNTEILDTKWVYSYKPLESDQLDKCKARLVVRGFAQKETFDYEELYSPVAKMTTIRTLLSIGNQFGYYFRQLDVKTAFLNGDLKEDIFIYPPNGVRHKAGHVFKLNKSLYGLKTII